MFTPNKDVGSECYQTHLRIFPFMTLYSLLPGYRSKELWLA